MTNDYLTVLLLVASFWAICLIQSGLDKVLDFQGNLGWLQGHFANTFLKGMVTPMLITLTAMELISGAACVVGAVQLLSDHTQMDTLRWGIVGVLITFVMLFFGQRIAKDYAGASTIAIYFAGALVSYMMIR